MAEALYRETGGSGFTLVTGTAPISVSGLTPSTVYEYPKGDGTLGEVTSGAAPMAAAPEITQEPGVFTIPTIGEEFAPSPAEASGTPNPSISYQYIADSVDDSGETDLTRTPVLADYGEFWEIETTAANGETPDAVVTTEAGRVAKTYVIDWDGIADNTQLETVSGWTNVGADTFFRVVDRAASPTGKALLLDPDSANNGFLQLDAMSTLVGNSTDSSLTDYAEYLYIMRIVPDTDNRTWFKPGQEAGFTFRLGVFYHQDDQDDVTLPDGNVINGFNGFDVAIRHRLEGSVSTLKVWKLDEAEPATPTDELTNPTAFARYDVRLGARVDGSGTPNELWYLSVGLNTPAPSDDPRLNLIPPDTVGVMEYVAPAEQGSSTVETTGLGFDITVEDNA